MKNSLLLMGAVAIALGHSPSARADDVGLSFDQEEAIASEPAPAEAALEAPEGPLALPPKTQLPPVQPFSWKDKELPPPPPRAIAANINVDSSQPFTADDFQQFPAADPPASPAVAETSPVETGPVSTGQTNTPTRGAVAEAPAASGVELSLPRQEAIAPAPELSFTPHSPAEPPELTFARSTTPLRSLDDTLERLFQGGSDSLIARTVGSAEGTRTVDGLRTRAYYGHSDPGNGVWNLGSFSYQHGATSPEEADDKQLRRLQNQSQTLQEQAAAKGLTLTLEEKLNGIDLANQSPRAALSRGGYIDRLAQARDLRLVGEEAILWARTRSYLDPDTEQWNAPGLGNTAAGVSHDQERRMRAIARALTAYQQENPNLIVSEVPAPSQRPFSLETQDFSRQSSQHLPSSTQQPITPSERSSAAPEDRSEGLFEQIIDQLMSLDLS